MLDLLPTSFLETMQRLLGEDYAAWVEAYLAPPAGLRANTLKIAPTMLRQRLPYSLKPIPWASDGFWVGEAQTEGAPPPGKHPYHAAGLYYLQDPSAMAVGHIVSPQAGERILDLCAAPGGKSTHLAALSGDAALLVANEIHPRRVWELAENLERWGARRVIVTNATPEQLAQRWGPFFDRVLVDAPCSGEAMFPKSEAARRAWSPQVVRSCALRQQAILESAWRLVRPGGRLVYATCTFNPQENEGVVAHFLARHPEGELVPIPAQPGFSPACPEWVPSPMEDLRRAVRLWPHLAPGEGHFIAVLQRRAAPGPPRSDARSIQKNASPLSRQERQAYQDFWQQIGADDPLEGEAYLLKQIGSHLYAYLPETPPLEGLRAVRPGWYLGKFQRGRRGELRFEPSHALALGLPSVQVERVYPLTAQSEEVKAYLRGGTLPWKGASGWVLVCVDGFPLGWGRAVGEQLKSAYPRRYRRP